MKILHTVESYLPSRHGMQEVVTQLSEALVKMGHEVTIATSYNPNRSKNIINGVKIIDFKIEGNYAIGITGNVEEYQNYLLSSNFDVITNFAAQQWATDVMLPLMAQIRGKKIFVPTGFSALGSSKYKEYFENMKVWMKEYHANVFLSDNYRDINFAKQNDIKAIEIIPNGASEEEFNNTETVDIRSLLGIASDAILVLSVGSHTGYKGHDKTIEVFQKAAVPNSALLIIGNVTTGGGRVITLLKSYINFFGLRKTNCSLSCKMKAKRHNLKHGDTSIHIKEFKRSLTVSAYKQADLFLLTSLIECSPIVLFEAMAGKTPFIVNDVGNSKEIISWTNGGELLPTKIDSMGFSNVEVAEASVTLRNILKSKKDLDKYATNGHNAFLENFTWEKIASRYEKLYLKLYN